jgi:Electron transfer DM13
MRNGKQGEETMNANGKSWIARNKWKIGILGLALLTGMWWAFRPEKLFVNQKVNEASPFAESGDAHPEFTGRLEGKLHSTSGRATIYRTGDGKEFLRLTDFATSNGPDVHVLLAQGNDPALGQEVVKEEHDWVELGALKGNQGDQNYDLPAAADVQKYQAVVIYCERFHAVFGVAQLEKF